MSPAAAKDHFTLSFDTVFVEMGSAGELPPRVPQTFWPYIPQSPASLYAQSRGGGGAAASGIIATATGAATEESSPLPVHASGAHTRRTAGRARPLRQSIDFKPSPTSPRRRDLYIALPRPRDLQKTRVWPPSGSGEPLAR